MIRTASVFPPAHTPYDGSSKPFSIGLRPLEQTRWIEIDGRYGAQMAEKDRLIATVPEKVFAEEADSRSAQTEVLALLRTHLEAALSRLAPDPATRDAATARLAASGQRGDEPPLLAAARLVQEDLVLMRRGEDGWRLAAAALCFPSSWTLAEKFGRPIHEIHAPVPGFGAGTRMAELIARIFDRLDPALPVERLNWSLQDGDELYRPKPARDAGPVSRFPGDPAASAFIRVERQTLRKLERSGDILFTIRIHLDPLRVLDGEPRRAALAASLARQLESLEPAQLAYKGLAVDRARLAKTLRAFGRPR